MSGMIGLLVVLLAGVGVAVGAAGDRRRGGPPVVPVAARNEARRVGRWSWGGLALGVVAALAVARWDDLGRGLLLAAPVLGLAVLVGTLGGELAVTGPASATRRAGLRARRVGDYLPRRPALVVAAAATALVATGLGATAVASDDDLGRSGRWLTTSCSPDTTSSRGPWPGWYYSGPMLALTVAGLVLAAIALRAVVNRPRLASAATPAGSVPAVTVPGPGPMPPGGSVAGVLAGSDAVVDGGAVASGGGGGPDALLGLDDALRRWSARRVVAACGVMVALPLMGTATVAAVVLAGSRCLPAAGRVAEAGLFLAAPAAAVLLGWSARALLAPVGFGRLAPGGSGAAVPGGSWNGEA